MARAPREVREERLQRFIYQRETALANIPRIEELLERIRIVEQLEKDMEALRHHIAVRLNLESNLADARSFAVRMEKAIAREQEWLARYDAEQDTGAETVGDETDTEDAAPQQAASIQEAEELLRVMDENRHAASVDPFEHALLKLAARRPGEVTVTEIRAVTQQYLLNRRQRKDVPPSVQGALARALLVLEEQLDTFRRAIDIVRSTEDHRK